ncbi:chemotaxis protein CheC [Halorutilales archaeon Cl-col2-1]
MPLLVDIRKLTVIDSLVKESSRTLADYIESLTGVESEIEVTGLTFIDPGDLKNEIGSQEKFNVVINMDSPPYGLFLLTFTPRTARRVSELMTGEEIEGEGIDGIHRSALQELCNVLTSGFIDGWANALDTSIEISTPEVERSSGNEISNRVVSHVHEDSLSIVIDTVMEFDETEGETEGDFNFEFYMIPDVGSFVYLIDRLDI